MLFNSYIFILAFLPIVCIGFYILLKNKKNTWLNTFLLLASIIFYVYAGMETLGLLTVQVVINYGIYKLLIGCNKNNQATGKKLFLTVGIIFNIGLLLYFKYFNFFIGTVNLIVENDISVREIIQPLGISFIVFQQIAFLIDTSRNQVEECGFKEYALFITFFPHVSSGPIILSHEFLPLLKKEKEIDWKVISVGIYMFVMGLGKKVLIADKLGEAVNWGYANLNEINTTSAIFISIVYSLQIYFDFSGYSDMAIGISRMLQLDLPINFNSPYKARTILEFWDRWHMTLTRFFTKYLYIPLGGSRKGKIRTYINTMIVFLVSGLWHGASWTFILWGGLHGVFMVFTKHFIKAFQKIPDWFNRIITLLFVNVSWIVFRAGSFSTLRDMMAAILKFKWGSLHENICSILKPVFVEKIEWLVVPQWFWAVLIVVVLIWIVLTQKNVGEKAQEMEYSLCSGIVVSCVALLCVLSFSGVTTFIYSLF